MDKQYRRALTLLRGTDLVEQDVRFRYLAAKCLVECQEWEECLKMVGGWEDDSLDSIDMQVTCCRRPVFVCTQLLSCCLQQHTFM